MNEEGARKLREGGRSWYATPITIIFHHPNYIVERITLTHTHTHSACTLGSAGEDINKDNMRCPGYSIHTHYFSGIMAHHADAAMGLNKS